MPAKIGGTNMKQLTIWILCVAIAAITPLAVADGEKKLSRADKKRARIDTMAAEGLEKLFAQKEEAKVFQSNSYGYAVFNNLKISLWITGGGGHGVVVRKGSNERIYMRTATAGLNLGLGGQKYYLFIFFENKQVFDRFIEDGWEADASANAVAGKLGVNGEAIFRNGMAIYQITKGGLMLQIDIAGTKYWKNKKLN